MFSSQEPEPHTRRQNQGHSDFKVIKILLLYHFERDVCCALLLSEWILHSFPLAPSNKVNSRLLHTFKKKSKQFYFVDAGVFPACMSLHVCSAKRHQKKASAPLLLGLQTAVSCRVGAGDLTWLLWRSSQCS